MIVCIVVTTRIHTDEAPYLPRRASSIEDTIGTFKMLPEREYAQCKRGGQKEVFQHLIL